MIYKVVLTEVAKLQLNHMLYYVRYVLKNPDAARSVRQDAMITKRKLTHLAESIKLCEEPELARRGYRVIFFKVTTI